MTEPMIELLPARARTLFSAAVSWILVANGVVIVVVTELDGKIPEAWMRWLLVVASVLGTAVAIVRRVSPVPAEERGLVEGP